MLEFTKSLGWSVLAEAPDREIVMGTATQPWNPNVVFRPLTPDQFVAFNGTHAAVHDYKDSAIDRATIERLIETAVPATERDKSSTLGVRRPTRSQSKPAAKTFLR